MIRSLLFRSISVLLLVLFGSPAARAQLETATVPGAILDPAGAAVPGCQVTLEGIEPVIRVTRITDASGDFEFFDIRIGRYQVQAELAGFNKAMSDPFTVTFSAEYGHAGGRDQREPEERGSSSIGRISGTFPARPIQFGSRLDF